MKCDKLKSLKNIEIVFNTTTQQEQVSAEDSEGNCYGFDSWEEVYLKDSVDEAIAELKAKIVEQDAENRRLKRALWLARSYRGRDNSILLPSKFMRNVWDNIERKCLKKAEEYK